jgi:hypothetical protein
MRSSLDRLWLIVAVGLPVLVALLVPLPAVDLAYQVRAGDGILSSGVVPTADTYSFSVAGQIWTDQQWLAQVLLAVGHGLGGWELLVLVRAALVGLVGVLLIAVGVLRGASLRTAAVLSLLAFLVSAPALALRPQLLAIAVFAGLLVLVAGRDRHPRAFLAAPLLVVLWANVHGSFVLAPLLLAYALLDDVLRRRPWRRSFAVLITGAIATCVTPFGPAVWGYAIAISGNPEITQRVSEWQRTSPLTPTGAIYYAAVAVAAFAAWRGRARLTLADWAWLGGLTVLGVWTVRGAAWWPAGAVLVVAAALSPGPEAAISETATSTRPMPRSLRIANASLIAALGIGIVLALPWWRAPDPLTGRAGILDYAPSGLAEALRAEASSGMRVFVPQTWGSWFEWAAPDAQYFVDSRLELFPADVWADYDAIAGGGANAQAALDRRRVDAVVVPASWSRPAGPWRVVYSDPSGALLTRDGS